MNHLFSVFRVLSLIMMIFGATMAAPLGLSWWRSDGAETAYDEALLLTIGIGGFLWWITRHHSRELTVRDGFLLVVLTWTALPALATLPLLLYIPSLSFTDAYFETVSGLTTTGATVLSGLDALPYSINFWRMSLVWLGGMGLIVLAVAVLPLLGVGGRQIFKAEAPGPMKESKLTPRMASTAKGLWLIYGLFSLICALAFRWAGMSWDDAVVHMFTTMGLGGFSTHDASFAYWNSPTIEMVTMVFMTLAGINFATHFVAIRGGGLGAYKQDPEVRWYLYVMFGSVAAIALYLLDTGTYSDPWEAIRYAAFNTISIATTTGFANTDYAKWPVFAPLWMLFLCSFITCAGSTGGGIKMMRAIILYKQVFRELMRSLHPHAVAPIKFGSDAVASQIIFAVLAFGFMYMVVLVSLTLLMVFTGLDPITAFSAVVACVNNTGPGLGQVGPSTTYAALSDLQTWICTFAMLLGRLEIFTLLVVLSPYFWRK